MVGESTTISFAALSAERIALSALSTEIFASTPFARTPFSLSLSYNPRTEAIICGLVPPLVKPKSLFPLIKIGRASLVLTRTLAYDKPS